MNISVFKDNQAVIEIDLGSEVIGNQEADVTFFIGRSSDCHVHLDDKQISREHAELSYKSGKWTINQLSPFSKIVINGTGYETKELSSGDIITIGPFVLNISLSIAPTEEVIPEETLEDEVDEEVAVDDFEEETVALSDDELSEDNSNEDTGEEDEFETSQDDGDGDEFESEFSDDEGTSDDEDDDLFGDSDTDEFSDDSTDSDEEFPVDTFDDDDDDDDDSTRVIQAFSKVELEIFGENVPYEKFIVDKPELFIGRDPDKCQIVLKDDEVSGVHAVIRKNNITCTVEDLDSGNGTLLNGARINKSIVTNGDEFIIGGTTFTVRISSDFLQEEQQRLMPVEENQTVEVEEIVEVDADFIDEETGLLEDGGTPVKTGLVTDLKNWKNLPPEKKKKYMIYGGILILLILILPDDEPKKKKIAKGKERSSRLGGISKSDSKKKKLLKKLSGEEEEYVESRYLLTKEHLKVGNYRESIGELNKIFAIISEYKQSKQLFEVAKEGLAQLEEQERKIQAEIAKKQRDAKVKILVTKAQEAVKATQVIRARSLFSEILSLEPENYDVPLLKQQIEAYERRISKEAMEKAQAESERKRQVDLLAPGKNYYLNKDWYKAILKLQPFVRKKDIDEDLMAEGSKMLSESKDNMNDIVQPLLGKARSLKEGQDLKGAYESYIQVLKYDLSNVEALDESGEIRDRLKNRSKKIYREAIIAESLSLFEDAKEKFQEVQQVSPSDSVYYKKATDKLKDYLD